VNFWPAKSFEDYLKLEDRIINRMAIMNLTGAETQELNDRYKKMVKDNTIQDKNAQRLLKELTENSISDIESQQSLSLKDFSFEVYRQDLVEYFEKHKEVFQKMPSGIFSGFELEDGKFENIPESLVAVIGYPRREAGNNKKYKSIYLVCQPIDTKLPTTYKELNQYFSDNIVDMTVDQDIPGQAYFAFYGLCMNILKDQSVEKYSYTEFKLKTKCMIEV
jgi:hypothetical protein